MYSATAHRVTLSLIPYGFKKKTVIFPNFMTEKSSIGLILTVLDSPETVLDFMTPTNKVAEIVHLITFYKRAIGFGLL